MNIQNITQDEAFTYNIDTPLLNNSNANRIALENFEYESNTNLSKISNFANNKFSVIVKDFNDVDFDNTKNIYKSKLAEITSLKTGVTYYSFDYFLTDSNVRLSYTKSSIIIQPDSSNILSILLYSGNNYFYLLYDFSLRYLRIYNQSTILQTYTNFIPLRSSYNYLYISFLQLFPYTNFTLGTYITAYLNNGNIIYSNSTIKDLEPYKNKIISRLSYQLTFTAISKVCKIIALDSNLICDRRLRYQNSLIPNNYSSDIKTFYSTVIPFYTNSLKYTSNVYRYATTIYNNRYLRYKTNCSQNDFDTYDFNSELDTSFSMKIECSLNDTIEGTDFRFNFNSSALYLTFSDKIYLYRYAYENYTQTDYAEYSYSSFFDNSSVIYAQFKNNIFSIGILYNFSVISHEYYFDGIFENLSIRGYFTNFNYQSLKTSNVISIKNSTNSIDIYHDIFTLRNKISSISSYFEFNEEIIIPSISYNAIIVNDKYYLLQSEYITSLNIESDRIPTIGTFTITDDFEVIYDLFSNSTSFNTAINTNMLYHKNGGALYLKSQFYSSSNIEVTIFLSIHYTKILIFTDHLPQDNLLISKILEILIPITIFFLIVIAFKSNSNSKYLTMIGMYIAIFTFYLMEYMTLLFMILCMGFLTFGFVLILKKEKNNEGGI